MAWIRCKYNIAHYVFTISISVSCSSVPFRKRSQCCHAWLTPLKYYICVGPFTQLHGRAMTYYFIYKFSGDTMHSSRLPINFVHSGNDQNHASVTFKIILKIPIEIHKKFQKYVTQFLATFIFHTKTANPTFTFKKKKKKKTLTFPNLA